MRMNPMLWCAAAIMIAAPLARAAEPGAKAAPRTVAVAKSGADVVGEGDVDLADDDDASANDMFAADAPEGHAHAMGGMGMHSRMRMGMGPGEHGLGDLRAKLNLTDDQQSRLADIHDRSARRSIPIQADLRIAALDLHRLMRADKPNQQAIEAQIDKLSALRASLQKTHVAAMLEARTVLTPAQQKIMREGHWERMHHMMGRHMGMGLPMGDEMDGDSMD